MTGGTGPTGPQGNAGPQGPPNGLPGAAGPGFYSSSTRLTITSVSSGTSLAFSNGSSSTYYNIIPTAAITTLSNASPGATVAGMFWVFRNNTASMITIGTLTNITVSYAGSASASTLFIGSGNSLTIVSAGGSSFIAF